MNELEIRANKPHNEDKINLFGDLFCGKTVFHADKLRLIQSGLYLTDDITSMCTISIEAAQKLVDDLYAVGLRPTKTKGEPE